MMPRASARGSFFVLDPVRFWCVQAAPGARHAVLQAVQIVVDVDLRGLDGRPSGKPLEVERRHVAGHHRERGVAQLVHADVRHAELVAHAHATVSSVPRPPAVEVLRAQHAAARGAAKSRAIEAELLADRAPLVYLLLEHGRHRHDPLAGERLRVADLAVRLLHGTRYEDAPVVHVLVIQAARLAAAQPAEQHEPHRHHAPVQRHGGQLLDEGGDLLGGERFLLLGVRLRRLQSMHGGAREPSIVHRLPEDGGHLHVQLVHSGVGQLALAGCGVRLQPQERAPAILRGYLVHAHGVDGSA